jgi:hypothetical protein
LQCPKCAVEQEQDREECVRCGIVFDRWRESQEQAILRRRTGSYATPTVELERTVPRWLVVLAVIAFVVMGVMWTRYRQSVTTKQSLAAKGNALINDITPAVNKARKRQAEEAERLRRMQDALERAEAGHKEAQPRAFSLDEQGAMRLVNQCRGTTIRETVVIPKDFSESDEQYSSILRLVDAAERDRLLFVERASGRIKVKSGYAADVPGLSDSSDRIEIDLGGRKVTEVTQMTGRADHVEAEMYCTFENKVACRRLGIKEKPARAGFILQDGAWRVEWATIPDEEREPFHLCR